MSAPHNLNIETPDLSSLKHQDEIMSRRFIRKILVGLILICSSLAIYAVYISSHNDGINANWKALVNNMQINDEISDQRPTRPVRPAKVKGVRYHGEKHRKRPNKEIFGDNKFDRAGTVNDYDEFKKNRNERVQYDERNRYNEVDETDNRNNNEDDLMVHNDAGIDVSLGDDRVKQVDRVEQVDRVDNRRDNYREDNYREDYSRDYNDREFENIEYNIRNDHNREDNNREDNNNMNGGDTINERGEPEKTLHPEIQQEIEKHVVRDEHGRVKSEKLFPFGINHLMKEKDWGQEGIDDDVDVGLDEHEPDANANKEKVDRPIDEDLLVNKVLQNDHQIIDLEKNLNVKEVQGQDGDWSNEERARKHNKKFNKVDELNNPKEFAGGNNVHNDLAEDKMEDNPRKKNAKKYNAGFIKPGKNGRHINSQRDDFEPTVGALIGINKIQENLSGKGNTVQEGEINVPYVQRNGMLPEQQNVPYVQRNGMLPEQQNDNKKVGERNTEHDPDFENGQQVIQNNDSINVSGQNIQNANGKLSPQLLNSLLQSAGLNKVLLQKLLQSLQIQENNNQQQLQQTQVQGQNDPKQQFPDQQKIIQTPAATLQQQIIQTPAATLQQHEIHHAQQQEVISQPVEKSTKSPDVETIFVEDLGKPLEVQLNCVNYPFQSGPAQLCIHKSGKDNEVSDKIETDGTYEKEIMDQFYQILNQDIGLDFLDIGAGIGVYSLAAALLHRNVLAVEPLFRNYRMLHKSALENKVTNKITLVRQALDNESYIGQMHYSHDGGFSNVTIVKLNQKMEQDPANLVHVTTLDNLLQVVTIKHALMKLDVNGLEGNILESGEKFFKEVSVPFILTHWSVSSNIMHYVRMLSALTKLGYKARVSWNGALVNSDFLKTDHKFLVWTKN